jgi:hypothetical protein
MKDQVLFQGEIITKMQLSGEVIGIFLLKNQWAKIAQIYREAFWQNADSKLYKSWYP